MTARDRPATAAPHAQRAGSLDETLVVGEPQGRRFRVRRGGRLVAAYTLGRARPYVYPLLTPRGLPVTEESPADHPHHQSVWLGQDGVDGVNYWLNGHECGTVHGAAPAPEVRQGPEGPVAIFKQRLTWTAPGGGVQLLEERTTAITAAPAATLVDVVSERRCAGGVVTLEATKEAGFGLRVLDQLDEDDGGVLANDRGGRGEAGTFDQDADWIDYSGVIAGQAVGIALFRTGDNPRHPWFTRAYGIVLNNHHRFTPQTLQPGEVLRLQWRVAAHDGAAETADVAALFAAYRRVCRPGSGGLAEVLAWPR